MASQPYRSPTIRIVWKRFVALAPCASMAGRRWRVLPLLTSWNSQFVSNRSHDFPLYETYRSTAPCCSRISSRFGHGFPWTELMTSAQGHASIRQFRSRHIPCLVVSCCLCMEVCPQFTEPTRFMGAAIINQVRLFNLHPTGAHLRSARLRAMMGDGGIHECSYAQNCVQICPKNIPLTSSISNVYGQVMRQAIGDLLQQPELTSAHNRGIADAGRLDHVPGGTRW